VLGIALSTLRTRWVSFTGALLAIVLGTGLVAMMISTLMATSVTPFPGPQRFAAAPAVVTRSTSVQLTVDGARTNLPVLPPGTVPAAVVTRLAATGRIVPDRTFPAQQAGGPSGQIGHAWSAAAFTPYRLVAGHAPAAATEVVIGGGSAALVGRTVQVATAAGTRAYTVSGVTAPVWFEQAIFFANATAAKIAPAVDAVVAYGPPAAVRQAAASGSSGITVLTGAARKQADPDPSGGIDELSSVQALAGTSTALGVTVAFFVMIATFAFVTDQRRRELGLLRAVGATPRQVRRMIISEAAVIGVVGSVLGCVLGVLGSSTLRTWIVGHNVAPSWFTVHPSAVPLLLAFAIGLVSALGGAVTATRRAARIRPTEALRDASVDQRVMSVTRWLLGLGLLAAGTLVGISTILHHPGDALIVKDDLAAFLPIVAGFALLAPVILTPVARIVTWPLGRLGAGSMVVRQGALTGGRRTAAIAVPVVLALGLAGSMLTLEATANAGFITAMQRQASADFVVVPNGGWLSSQEVTAVRRIPDAAVTVFSSTVITLATRSGAYVDTMTAQAASPATLTRTQRFTPTAGSVSRLGSNFLIIDQRTAQADSLSAGEQVRAYLPDGTIAPLRVAAVIRTGLTQTTAYLPAADAAGGNATQVDVRARPGASVAALGAALRTTVHGQDAQVMPTARYLDAVVSQQQTQNRQATLVILGIALIYCIIAIANTLVMAASGRKREIAALSMAGTTHRQALRFITAEAGLVVLIGAILAAGATAAVVAGQRAALTRFATAVPISIPWFVIGEITGACCVVAVAVSLLSGWRVLQGRVLDLADLRE
jgi:putative ABC transport system permease protein